QQYRRDRRPSRPSQQGRTWSGTQLSPTGPGLLIWPSWRASIDGCTHHATFWRKDCRVDSPKDPRASSLRCFHAYVICYCGSVVSIDENVRIVKLIKHRMLSRWRLTPCRGPARSNYCVLVGMFLAWPQLGQNFD